MWDVVSLKCTFRKTGDENLLELWDEVYQLASTIIFRHEEDSLVWQFSSNGIYSVPSLYKVINFIGIQPVLISAIRDIKSPQESSNKRQGKWRIVIVFFVRRKSQ